MNCDRPERDKQMAHSKVPGIEQSLNKGGDHFSCTYCQTKPQCNMQTTDFVSSDDPHYSSEANYYCPTTSSLLLSARLSDNL